MGKPVKLYALKEIYTAEEAEAIINKYEKMIRQAKPTKKPY